MQRCCQIQGKPHEKDSISYGEGIMTGGDQYCSYEGEETLAVFSKDGEGCVVRRGNIFSFGFLFGAVYMAKVAPHVLPQYKNNAFYPLPTMRKNVLKDILERYISVPGLQMGKGIERAVFRSGSVIVNHTSFPVSVKQIHGKKIFQYLVNESLLLPRSAVFIKN